MSPWLMAASFSWDRRAPERRSTDETHRKRSSRSSTMRARVKGLLATLALAAAAALFVALVLGPTVGEGQTSTYRAPRLPGTQSPNFNGVWQAFTTANWDVLDHWAQPRPHPQFVRAWGVQPEGRGIVAVNEIPPTGEGLAHR